MGASASEPGQLVGRVVTDILARMALLASDPCEKRALPRAPGATVVRMTFDGPRRGALDLALPAALCTQVAANLLGLEDARAEAHGLAAAQELLNVICGHVIEALLGADDVFVLGPPSGGPLSDGGWDELVDAAGSCGFLVEDEHPLLLRVALEA
jgi:hypothetical protein